jgi:hypothetical protein
VSPLKSQGNGAGPETKSLREVARQINNEQDFKDYVLSFSTKAAVRPSEIKYERHPVSSTFSLHESLLTDSQTLNTQQQPSSPSTNRQSFGMQGGVQGPSQLPPLNFAASNQGAPMTSPAAAQQLPSPNAPMEKEGLPPSLQQPQPPVPGQGMAQPQAPPQPQLFVPAQFTSSQVHENAPQVGNLMHNRQDLPPLNPVFGISLDELFRRDGSAVPMIVYQCLQAVDLFGLEVEGIYRLSGSATHVMQMKSMFDNGGCPRIFRAKV